MKYLFYDTLKDCQDRINEINKVLLPYIDGNVTQTYCLPEKHPTKEIYSLCIDESFLYLFTENELKTAKEKDDSWIVKMEMI